MKRFAKLLAASLFVLFLSGQIFAAEGVVSYVKGKVEVQRNNNWVTLNVGDKVSQSETISTGFQSEAKIKLMDSVLYLGPVTRVTLEALKSTASNDKVNIYLATGSTRSKVEHDDSKRVNYTVRTAVAVASVRGTDWTMNSFGNIACFEGGVAVSLLSALRSTLMAKAEVEEEETEDLDSFEDSVELPTGGILVSANQSVVVSAVTSVSAPKSNSTNTLNAILSQVSSASSKEAVSSSTSTDNSVDVDDSESGYGGKVNPEPKPPVPGPTTGTVVVEVEVES
jgi:hypothetical protein